MRRYLAESNWLNGCKNLYETGSVEPNDLWMSLKLMLHDMTKRFIPVETPSDKYSWRSKGSIPLDKETRQAIKLKERCHRQWMTAIKLGGLDTAKDEYVKARNDVKRLLRRAKRKYERGIALTAKTNPKFFWSHTRRTLKTKSVIAPLLKNEKDDTSMKFDDESKAEILSDQYSSVFTKEDLCEIPRIESRTESSMVHKALTLSVPTYFSVFFLI